MHSKPHAKKNKNQKRKIKLHSTKLNFPTSFTIRTDSMSAGFTQHGPPSICRGTDQGYAKKINSGVQPIQINSQDSSKIKI